MCTSSNSSSCSSSRPLPSFPSSVSVPPWPLFRIDSLFNVNVQHETLGGKGRVAIEMVVCGLTKFLPSASSAFSASATSSCQEFELIVVSCSNDHLIFCFQSKHAAPCLRILPWFQNDKNKKIVAMDLSGNCEWLICVTFDGTIYLLPVRSFLYNSEFEVAEDETMSLAAMFEQRVSTAKKMLGPPANLRKLKVRKGLKSISQCRWWTTLNEQEYVIVCGLEGDLVFVDLQSGASFPFEVKQKWQGMEVIPCHSDEPSTYLLLHCLNGSSHLVLLEQLRDKHRLFDTKDDKARGMLYTSCLDPHTRKLPIKPLSRFPPPLKIRGQVLKGESLIGVEGKIETAYDLYSPLDICGESSGPKLSIGGGSRGSSYVISDDFTFCIKPGSLETEIRVLLTSGAVVVQVLDMARCSGVLALPGGPGLVLWTTDQVCVCRWDTRCEGLLARAIEAEFHVGLPLFSPLLGVIHSSPNPQAVFQMAGDVAFESQHFRSGVTLYDEKAHIGPVELIGKLLGKGEAALTIEILVEWLAQRPRRSRRTRRRRQGSNPDTRTPKLTGQQFSSPSVATPKQGHIFPVSAQKKSLKDNTKATVRVVLPSTPTASSTSATSTTLSSFSFASDSTFAPPSNTSSSATVSSTVPEVSSSDVLFPLREKIRKDKMNERALCVATTTTPSTPTTTTPTTTTTTTTTPTTTTTTTTTVTTAPIATAPTINISTITRAPTDTASSTFSTPFDEADFQEQNKEEEVDDDEEEDEGDNEANGSEENATDGETDTSPLFEPSTEPRPSLLELPSSPASCVYFSYSSSSTSSFSSSATTASCLAIDPFQPPRIRSRALSNLERKILSNHLLQAFVIVLASGQSTPPPSLALALASSPLTASTPSSSSSASCHPSSSLPSPFSDPLCISFLDAFHTFLHVEILYTTQLALELSVELLPLTSQALIIIGLKRECLEHCLDLLVRHGGLLTRQSLNLLNGRGQAGHLLRSASGGFLFRALPPRQRLEVLMLDVFPHIEHEDGGAVISKEHVVALQELVPHLDRESLVTLGLFVDPAQPKNMLYAHARLQCQMLLIELFILVQLVLLASNIVVPFPQARLLETLERHHGLYRASIVIHTATLWHNYEALAKVFELHEQHQDACECRFFTLENKLRLSHGCSGDTFPFSSSTPTTLSTITTTKTGTGDSVDSESKAELAALLHVHVKKVVGVDSKARLLAQIINLIGEFPTLRPVVEESFEQDIEYFAESLCFLLIAAIHSSSISPTFLLSSLACPAPLSSPALPPYLTSVVPLLSPRVWLSALRYRMEHMALAVDEENRLGRRAPLDRLWEEIMGNLNKDVDKRLASHFSAVESVANTLPVPSLPSVRTKRGTIASPPVLPVRDLELVTFTCGHTFQRTIFYESLLPEFKVQIPMLTQRNA